MHLVATEVLTVVKWVVRILLEYFVVTVSAGGPVDDLGNSRYYFGIYERCL